LGKIVRTKTYVKAIARKVFRALKQFGVLLKIGLQIGRDVKIDPSVNMAWSVSIDPARGSISVGRNCSLSKGVLLHAYGGYIKIGENSSINPYCVLYGLGGIKIGNGVRIAPHVSIIASNHIFSDPNIFIFKQGETKKGIVIEDDVWIGTGARVLDGVTLAKGTVVGAGAVVTKSSDPYTVIVGIPAKAIATRLL
jgi:acetyltransferase-like isoleucine patch superfamily enzyme